MTHHAPEPNPMNTLPTNLRAAALRAAAAGIALAALAAGIAAAPARAAEPTAAADPKLAEFEGDARCCRAQGGGSNVRRQCGHGMGLRGVVRHFWVAAVLSAALSAAGFTFCSILGSVARARSA